MSRSLLKKALNMYVQEETKPKEVKTSKKKADLSKPEKKKKKSIVERKREAKKNRMKLKTSVQDVKIGFILDEVRKESNVDNTESNLMILNGISNYQKNAVKKTATNKILKHTRGRLAKNSEIEKPKEAPESIFTEKDFAEFERTFFVKI